MKRRLSLLRAARERAHVSREPLPDVGPPCACGRRLGDATDRSAALVARRVGLPEPALRSRARSWRRACRWRAPASRCCISRSSTRRSSTASVSSRVRSTASRSSSASAPTSGSRAQPSRFSPRSSARWDELARRPSVPQVAAFALTFGLLAAYILPWLLDATLRTFGRGGAAGTSLVRAEASARTLHRCCIACFGLAVLDPRDAAAIERLVAALGRPGARRRGRSAYCGIHVHWPYEAWLQLGCSLGLVALALATSRGLRISVAARSADVAAVAAASSARRLDVPATGRSVCSGPVGRAAVGR